MSEELRLEVIRLYIEDGFSIEQIAAEMLFDEDIVWYVLNHEGVL